MATLRLLMYPFKAADKTAIYEVDGFNTNGAHSMTLDVATGNVTEGTPKHMMHLWKLVLLMLVLCYSTCGDQCSLRTNWQCSNWY